jgi:predicted site-specific integrase-resolvase
VNTKLKEGFIMKGSYVTPKEAAEMLHISPRTLANWRWAKKNLPYRVVARRVLYRKEDVERFIQQHPVIEVVEP